MLLANHFLLILCIFIKSNVWYSWSFKILAIIKWSPFNFAKDLKGRHFVAASPKNSKLLLDISFDSGFQKIVLWSLLLNLCACYWVDLVDIQWNKVGTSTVRKFSNSWPLYLNFSNMINLFQNIRFIKTLKCPQFLFWKKNRQKTQIFHFLKDRYFVMCRFLDMNLGVFWDTSEGFRKIVVLQLFPKYSQIYIIWISNVVQGSTALER